MNVVKIGQLSLIMKPRGKLIKKILQVFYKCHCYILVLKLLVVTCIHINFYTPNYKEYYKEYLNQNLFLQKKIVSYM